MQSWEELEESCLNCTRCELCKNRNNVVIGKGCKTADIMLIGEGPGEQEDLQGLPFVGPAGKFLDDMLSIIDLDLSNTYVANIVKCRPPGNRDPLDEEQDACIDYLRAQVALVKPKIIICLGRIAARRIIDTNYKISRDHGTWIDRNDTWITALYHPSALLRDLQKRPETFEDLMYIREKIIELGIDIKRESHF